MSSCCMRRCSHRCRRWFGPRICSDPSVGHTRPGHRPRGRPRCRTHGGWPMITTQPVCGRPSSRWGLASPGHGVGQRCSRTLRCPVALRYRRPRRAFSSQSSHGAEEGSTRRPQYWPDREVRDAVVLDRAGRPLELDRRVSAVRCGACDLGNGRRRFTPSPTALAAVVSAKPKPGR